MPQEVEAEANDGGSNWVWNDGRGWRIEPGTMAKRRQNWGKTPWTVSFRSQTTALPDHVDFAVVGGGFTGLSAAAWLARLAPKKSVLLLEAALLGNGASGRTGGMVLAQSAAGDLRGLGNVLRGYRRILHGLGVEADLDLPGVWEVARGGKSMEGKKVRPLKRSPIDWIDSGRVRAVGKVPGGTVDPGKVVSGLAQAAVKFGAQIVEDARVLRIEYSDPLRLHVRRKVRGRAEEKVVNAEKVLLATNAGSLELAGTLYEAKESAEPKLTFAVATTRLTTKQIDALGMNSGQPFYTVDFPYLWGRKSKNAGMIFGSGLVPAFGETLRDGARMHHSAASRVKEVWSGLEKFDVRRGEAAERLRSLEERVRRLHPALKRVRFTHRWGGPILITKDFVPTFRRHSKNGNVLVLGGFSGHGVALSVYLGHKAAQHFVGRYALPTWHSR
jgi:gamma-glutamylputrescine oxidase